MLRNKFIFGIIYLAYNSKFKYQFHNYPKTPAFTMGDRESEFVFVTDLLRMVTGSKYAEV
jgi:hypothetical protein